MAVEKNFCIIRISSEGDSDSLNCKIRFSPAVKMKDGEYNPPSHFIGVRLFSVLTAMELSQAFNDELLALLKKYSTEPEGGAA